MDSTPAPVVVGIGATGSRVPTDFAAVEAKRRGCGLHLVHALDPSGPRAGDPATEEEGRLLLDDAVRRARVALDEAGPITATLSRSPAVPALYASAHDAPLVVVGRRLRARSAGRRAGSVAAGVAARVHVPVAVVPDDWENVDLPGHVVVGVDEPAQCGPVLRAAFEAARSRQALLSVVRAHGDPAAALLGVVASRPGAALTDRLRAAVEDELGALRVEFADVSVDVQIDRRRPAAALVSASRDACLLVLGRHDPARPRGAHLGPTTRSVLAEAACPVLLTTPRRTQRPRRPVGGDLLMV